VQMWADILSNLLTRVYNHLFGGRDLAEELRLRVEQKRKLLRARFPNVPLSELAPERLITDEDLFVSKQRTQVTLAFDLIPVAPLENLDHMHLNGIIEWPVYAESVLRLNHMPRSYLAHAKRPAPLSLPQPIGPPVKPPSTPDEQ